MLKSRSVWGFIQGEKKHICQRSRQQVVRLLKSSDSPIMTSPLSSISLSKSLSGLSAARQGLIQRKMSENGVTARRSKVLTIDTINAAVKKVEYAVRGPIVQRAVQLEKELKEVCKAIVTIRNSLRLYVVAKVCMYM